MRFRAFEVLRACGFRVLGFKVFKAGLGVQGLRVLGLEGLRGLRGLGVSGSVCAGLGLKFLDFLGF